MMMEEIENVSATNATGDTPIITHFPTPYTDAEKSAETKVKA